MRRLLCLILLSSALGCAGSPQPPASAPAVAPQGAASGATAPAPNGGDNAQAPPSSADQGDASASADGSCQQVLQHALALREAEQIDGYPGLEEGILADCAMFGPEQRACALAAGDMTGLKECWGG